MLCYIVEIKPAALFWRGRITAADVGKVQLRHITISTDDTQGFNIVFAAQLGAAHLLTHHVMTGRQ